MRSLISIFLLSFLLSCDNESDCCGSTPNPVDKELIRGVDVSFLPGIEEAGVTFENTSGTEKDMLSILKESGVNAIRLRIWHTPVNEHASLEEVKILAARVKANGMKVWLTVHYSDTWADPAHQVKPAAWNEAAFVDLKDSVYLYTKKIMTAIDPDIIQIGNEINGGFLLPSGSTSNVPDFIALLKEGVRASREVSPDTKIMVHVAGFDVAAWFYQQLKTNSVDYDYIGLSYYPLWHGKDLAVVKTIIDGLGAANSKEVIVAETAYPFSLGWEDDINNVVGLSEQLIPGYPASSNGQKEFMQRIRKIITDSPRGAGFCYWGAEWVAYTGQIEIEGELETGSTWENQALFDFTNKAVPALEAFADED